MNPPNSENDGEINLKSLEYIIKEEQKRLEEDKFKLQRNIEKHTKRRSDGNHNQPYHNATLPEDKPNNGLQYKADVIDSIKGKCTPKDKSKVFMVTNPREEEINKLIDKISKPKEQQSFTNIKEQRRSYPQARSNFTQFFNPINIREREKDQLSEKFASSECPLTKPSSRQIAKNLCSSISFSDSKENNLEKTNDKGQAIQHLNKEYCYAGENNTNREDGEEYLRAKYNHPKIVISHYKESNKDEDIGNLRDNKMVRIGVFSPLNPNLPGGATVLGLGDWDEKRQFLLERYRQVSRSPSPSFCESDHSHNQRSIATQTELGSDWSPNVTLERSPQPVCQTQEKSPHTPHPWRGHGCEDDDKRCSTPQSRLSPIPKCYENMTEKEVKEYIYRQELARQIEEKNRLKEEIKRKEAEEDAKIEAKIQRDLENMRRQYEEERLQRLELAIRKREQEDLFRERLAVEQQKTMLESKIIKKRPVKDSDLQNYAYKQHEKGTQSDFGRSAKPNSVKVPYSRSLPEQSAASALSSVHKELRQPLLQPASSLLSEEELDSFLPENKSRKNTSPSLYKTKKSSTHTSKSPPLSVRRSKEVDILWQKAVFDTNLKTSPRMNNVTAFHSNTVRDRLKEVDNILKQPLLPESQRVLPPVSQPLIHATIPPLSASLLTPRGGSPTASNRTNADILEDKWKVPYVEPDTEPAPSTKHNARILTQLGTFRRQLQEESLRMRQRVREDSP